jgi:hypothetical protein
MCALKVPQAKRDVIKKMNAQGKTDSEIAEVIGFGRWTVGSYRKRMGLPARGGRNPQPTEAEKAKIIKLAKDGATFGEAVVAFNCTYRRLGRLAKIAGVSFPDRRKAFSKDESKEVRLARARGESFAEIGRKLGRGEKAGRSHVKSAAYQEAEQAVSLIPQEPAPEKRKRVAIPPQLLRTQSDQGVKQAPQDDHLIARHGAALVAEVKGVPKRSEQASRELAAIAARHGLQGSAVRSLWHRVAS